MNKIKLQFPEKLKPYQGVIYFVVIMSMAHFLWKFTVIGDESDTIVSFFGIDISGPFTSMADHVATTVTKILNFVGYDISHNANNILRFDNGNAVRIVWACTGIKQAYIFFCIIAFYRGPVKKKLWYIPLGIAVTYFFNIFRIAVITAIIHHHKEWFDLVHEHIFKYLFYGLIFGMWVLWEEKLAGKLIRKSEVLN